MATLSQKQSNAWHYLEDRTTTEVLYGGAAGGGKSFLLCLWHIDRRLRYPGSRGMIGRAKLNNLEESTLITLFDVAKMLGYVEGVDFRYNQQKHIIIWSNGSRTILKDLFLYPADPDFKSLGSTEYTDACIDEVNEVTEKAKEMVTTRIRYKLDQFGLEPKLFMSCNPGEGWVKDTYVIKDEKPVVLKPHQKFIQALVDDNPDKAFVERYKRSLDNLSSDYDKQRLLYGDWEAVRDVTNSFAFNYSKKKHEHSLVAFDPGKQLLISIDFNLNPFGVIFAQIYRHGGVDCCYIIDEMSIENGSISKMVDQIKIKYGKYLSGCFVTGDSMGKSRNISQPDHASNYELLRRGLGISKTQLKLPNNPGHVNSRTDVNYILEHFPEFKINPINCPNTCRDLRVVQCDAFGEIIKKNRKDINQLADHLDCFVGETLIMTIDGNRRIDEIKIGDYVLTRKGYKKVIDVWSSESIVSEYTFSDSTTLKCTDKHRFYSHNTGFVEIFRIFDQKLTVWKNKSFITGKFTENTQSKNIITLRLIKKSIRDLCIGKYGLTIMESCQKACKFITKMVMPLIIPLKTWSLLSAEIMQNSIQERESKITQSILKSSNEKGLRKLKIGIVQKKGLNGIYNMPQISLLESEVTELENANYVVRNSRLKTQLPNSVPHNVRVIGKGYSILQWLKGIAKNAVQNMRQQNGSKGDSVKDHAGQHQTLTVKKVKKAGVMKVYDITVEDEHEFYANGILVHNCVRYLINTFLIPWKINDMKKR